MRAAIYSGTRNLYQSMMTSAKSLLMHSNVEKIYFLIQDDIFPYEIPETIECINIKNQQYFRHDGPNYKTRFTYMALIRGALTKIFPELDAILSLDVDIIIDGNISELWDLNLDNYYLAAVAQRPPRKNYYNAGVMMLNLKKLRDDHVDDKIIEALNTQYYKFDIQDCYSEYCINKILQLPADYNFNYYTYYAQAKRRKIIHYAGIKFDIWSTFKLVDKYRQIKFNQLPRNVLDQPITLDIIIPSYNDKEGLITSLESIIYDDFKDWLKVTIVDDASDINYQDIISRWPEINIIYLPENGGPGNARAQGIKNTSGTFLTFVDCGDIILSKYALLEIKDTLENHKIYDVYYWPWILQSSSITQFSHFNGSTPGFVYDRNFLNLYNLYPYSEKDGSYCAEDCSFNNLCRKIIEDQAEFTGISSLKKMRLPIYLATTNQDSLTRKDKHAFKYQTLLPVIKNGEWVLLREEELHLSEEVLLATLNQYLIHIYISFLKILKKSKQNVDQYWMAIKHFYDNYYKKYLQHPMNNDYLSASFSCCLKEIRKWTTRPNIKKFINDLAQYTTCPDYYYTLK